MVEQPPVTAGYAHPPSPPRVDKRKTTAMTKDVQPRRNEPMGLMASAQRMRDQTVVRSRHLKPRRLFFLEGLDPSLSLRGVDGCSLLGS